MKGNFAEKEEPSPYAATAVSVRFINKCSCALTLEWIDHAADAAPRGTIEAGQTSQVHTWQGHLWRISSNEESKPAKLLYAAPTEHCFDTLVIDDDLLRDRNDARKPQNEMEYPHVFIRDGAVWMRSEPGSEERMDNSSSLEEALFDKTRVYMSSDKMHAVVWQYSPEQEHLIHLVESSPADQLEPKLKSIQYLKPGDRLRIDRPRLFNLKERKEVPTDDTFFHNPWSLTNIGWNNESGEYRFLFNERGHQCLRVVGLSLDGEVRVLVEETSDTFIDYSTKLYHHVTSDSRNMIWASERDGWNHLYLYDLVRGSVRNQITSGEWMVRSVDRVDEESRQIWFTACGIMFGQDPYYEQLVRVNFDGSELKVITEGDGTHSWKWSPDNRYLIDTWSRVDNPPETVLRESKTGSKIMVIKEAQLSRLIEKQWNAPERFSVAGRDGKTMIYGIIIRPADFDTKKKYPILECVYAGPHSFFTPKGFSGLSWLRQWADLGYILVRLDGMGTNWRSKAFHDICYKNLQDAGFPDRIKWIKEAAATRPWMDLDRVGLFGGSAGGQSVGAALIYHGDFYKVGAADCGCHDNRMDKIWWNEQWMGWPVDKAYEDASNVVNAHKLQGHLMLLVGDLDHNVDPSSTYQFANALNKAGKMYEMLIIPGGQHGCGGNTEYGRMRQADFFKRHLRNMKID
ncbi:hypothetical protein NLG97_g880 [Lecanicillium saksenae]|uniref:Uncharacterized protein n=1 Tax=Lecanicillium saksenae TaxID=468837 RepID=A0ACC1R9F2_9HYPO|nr:hypothetical protein NLG97_g880 [Lecanicillium saksenae]